MVRVILDTNVLVSALLKPGGIPEAAVNFALNGLVVLCVSEPVMSEYFEVLRRPRLRLHPDQVDVFLSRISAAAIHVTPRATVRAAKDFDDNIFLECAEAAEADYLVTGNLADFPPIWRKTRIIGPRELFQLVAESVFRSVE